MYFQVTVRFISAIVGALAAFYLGARLFHTLGYLSDQEVEHVGWMYAQLLAPITTLDWTSQRTILIVAVLLSVQALLIATLFRRWGYRPMRTLDPIVRQVAVRDGIVDASAARLSHDQMPIYRPDLVSSAPTEEARESDR